ncbi:Bacterial PH domain protein [uncultured archaeon]|nr:Bacterial PH domain protein [uncultured archaeon]
MAGRQELDDYIRQCKASNFTRQQVERTLADSGWKEGDYRAAVDEAYGKIGRNKPAAPLPANASLPPDSDKPLILHPVHEYKQIAPGAWPVRKILHEECSKTYAPIQPVWQLVRGVWLLGLIIIFLICSLVSAAAVGPVGPLLAVILFAPLILAEGIEVWQALDTYRFSLQPEYVFVRAGAINPHYHLLPYENIQDAQVDQGLLERIFGVASVVVSTPASEARIPFLKMEDAKKFSHDVLTLARTHKNLAE